MRTIKPKRRTPGDEVVMKKITDPVLNPEQIQEGDRVRSTKEYREEWGCKFTGTVALVMGTPREVFLCIVLDKPMPHRPEHKKIHAIDARWVKKRPLALTLFPFQKGRRNDG